MKGSGEGQAQTLRGLHGFGEQTFFATIEEAASTYRATHPVEWVDWEDRTL